MSYAERGVEIVVGFNANIFKILYWVPGSYSFHVDPYRHLKEKLMG